MSYNILIIFCWKNERTEEMISGDGNTGGVLISAVKWRRNVWYFDRRLPRVREDLCFRVNGFR